jgi:flagellar hook-basal body complex protein FliE
MSNMQIDNVLAQIRSFSAQGAGGLHRPSGPAGLLAPGALAPGKATGATGAPDFGSLLRQGIDSVNSTQQGAAKLADSFERGAPGVELAQVMLESQKASVSFRALTEVRNRLVNVYQEIMNMPI